MFKFIILFLIISTNLFSRPIATVVRLKGSASQLMPGTKFARDLNSGDQLIEHTSIVTKEKSYVVLKFDDGSRMSLGPSGKLVVERMSKTEVSVVNLLKGKIRSTVTKSNKNNLRNKLLIKTRSAALGVRGTDFTTIYNPENKMTSLVTLEGEVAMAKIKSPSSKTRRQVREDRNVEVNSDNEIEIKERTKIVDTSIEKIQNVLDSNKAVLVKQGQYSGSTTGLSRVTEPVKINPVQLNVLFNNKNLVEKENRNIKKVDMLKVNTKNLKIIAAAQDAPPEGYFDKVSGKYAPRAGGIVDLETGIYVPPTKNSVLDKNTGTYLSNESGTVDSQTGQYVAPKGLKLDSKDGFVVQDIRVLDTKNEESIKNRLASLQTDLNQNTMTDVILYDPEEDIEEELYIRLGEKEKLNRDIITFEFSTFGQNLESADDNLETNGGRDFSSDTSTGVLLTMDHSTNSKWQGITSFGFKSVPYNDADQKGYSKKSSSLVALGAGARFYISPTWYMKTMLNLEQYLFVDHVTTGTSTNKELTRSMVPKLSITFEGEYFKRRNFSLVSDLGLMTNLPKEAGATEIKPGFGLYADFGFKYQHNNKWISNTRAWFEGFTNDLEGSGFTSTNDRQSTGLKISVSYIFN